MNDAHNLQRFVDAQNPVFEHVCAELCAGRKTGHWMWFIFPQIRGLGSSETARYFAISSSEEAKAYLEHPILGPRLRECSKLVTLIQGKSVDEIFGYPDNLKFHSSMTLFATLFAHAAAENEVFIAALKMYFGNKLDSQTLDRI